MSNAETRKGLHPLAQLERDFLQVANDLNGGEYKTLITHGLLPIAHRIVRDALATPLPELKGTREERRKSQWPAVRAERREKPHTYPLESQMLDLLEALRQWEFWYSVDSTEFLRDEAREYGLALLEKHKVKVTT